MGASVPDRALHVAVFLGRAFGRRVILTVFISYEVTLKNNSSFRGRAMRLNGSGQRRLHPPCSSKQAAPTTRVCIVINNSLGVSLL